MPGCSAVKRTFFAGILYEQCIEFTSSDSDVTLGATGFTRKDSMSSIPLTGTFTTIELRESFEQACVDITTFVRTQAVRQALESPNPPGLGDLILLILRHVPSAEFLPVSILVAQLEAEFPDR